ncbi:MAG: long-chain fatty acid--CoA ligase [Vicinamibacteria bacterium]
MSGAQAPPITLPALLDSAARAFAERPALAVREGDGWRTTSWAEYRQQVRLAARGLIALGVAPSQGVALIGRNRPEWVTANLAAIAAGARPAGIYVTSAPEQCRYVVEHCEAEVAIVENEAFLRTFEALRERLPRLRTIVVMDPPAALRAGLMPWRALLERGCSVPESALDERLAAQAPDDVACLIYTSGTTGNPKAVMLSHANLVWVARAAGTYCPTGPEDRFLSYLPLCHAAEQVVSLYQPMIGGGCTYFVESLELLGERLRQVRPTFFLGVPRVWEKMQAAMQAAGASASPLHKRLVRWARRVGLEGGYAEQRDRPRPFGYGLAQRLVFRKVRERLGLDQARYCVVAAAPVSIETLEFFLSLGIPIYEVYGMSETTAPATMSLPGAYRTGWAGIALPGTEIRLAADGEVLMRGPHAFKGYYKDEAATRETIDADGFVRSGDVGEMSADGYLRITDRKKELIITAGAKNVAPQPIESRLRRLPAVSQAAVIGDRRPYLVALLTLDPTTVVAEAAAAGSPAKTTVEAAVCPLFRARVEAQLAVVNAELARYEQVRRFALLPGEFSVEADELTPTMKLKRRVVSRKHASLIETLYSGT